MSLTRTLSYSLAINEALHQAMAADPTVLLIGQGVKSPWYVGNTAQGLLERFGPERVIDTPVSENAVTGAAVGAALAGMRPVVVHPRMDFMLYAFDPIVNEAANWSYMNGGAVPAPLVFWGIINRLGEQAAQHSQALHSIFAHVPGLKVVMPATPYDAKGLMIAAIQDPDPVVFIDDRLLYHLTAPVPEEAYSVEIGKAALARQGKDVSIVAISSMVPEALKAAEQLCEEGIDAEIIDLRTAKPLDRETVLESVSRTGRLVAADISWRTCGLAAEVCATVCEAAFKSLRAAVARVTLPDCSAPASASLEEAYYPRAAAIAQAARKTLL
jgi:pyruvate/2-oxoglutarate/acetoin dehydrogenase E1 component